MPNLFSWSRLVLILLSAQALVWAQEPDQIQRPKALVITGQNNHDWEFSSKLVQKLLAKDFEVAVTRDPAVDLADQNLDSVDLFFLDYNGERWGDTAESAFLARVKKGAGVVVMHAANNAFVGWTEYEKLVALCWRKGTGHGKFHSFNIDVVDRNHPITWDLAPLKSHSDELYHRLVPTPGAEYRVLMTANAAEDKGGSGRAEPMAVISAYGKGRVFHTPLGHVWRNKPKTRASLNDKALQNLLQRGAQWAATGKCETTPKEFRIKSGPARDPKVFRCVLDKRARMVILALDARCWIAYDAAQCAPYKAWPGGVDFRGAVYTAEHGPQPLAVGTPYFSTKSHMSLDRGTYVSGENGDPQWRLSWRGYVLEGEKVWLRYGHKFKDGREILVEESPAFDIVDGQAFLLREFRVTGLRAGETVHAPQTSPLDAKPATNALAEITFNKNQTFKHKLNIKGSVK